ncbi:hypothetical protein M501DRAFT_994312, partial [Patellaria atrata CBS 101060]
MEDVVSALVSTTLPCVLHTLHARLATCLEKAKGSMSPLLMQSKLRQYVASRPYMMPSYNSNLGLLSLFHPKDNEECIISRPL